VRQARNLHCRRGRRLRGTFRQAPLRELDDIDFVGSLDRTGGLGQAVALLAVSLQELVHQLLTQSVQLPFQVAFAHLLGFAR
jgi:hypothetical protein